MKRLVRGLVLGIWGAVLALPLGASAEEWKLVTGDDYAPYTGTKLPNGGLATHLVQAALEAMGDKVTIEFLPWKLGYDLVARGEFDGTFPYILTEERQKVMRFGEPVLVYSSKAISAAKKPVAYRGQLSDLYNKVYCNPVGYASFIPIEKDTPIPVEHPVDMRGCLKMVLGGFADFLIHDMHTLMPLIESEGIDINALHIPEVPIDVHKERLMTSLANPRGGQLLERFKQGLEKLKENGEFARIWKEHLGEAPSE